MKLVLGAASVACAAIISIACGKDAAATTADIAALSATGVATGHVEGNNFKVDTEIVECTAGNECVGTIRLEALGGFHINDQYPYKFTANDAPGVEFHGKDATAKVFSKAAGDFEKQAEKIAVLKVRFKAPKGRVAFGGKFKLSVCSEANCQLEQVDVAFEGHAK